MSRRESGNTGEVSMPAPGDLVEVEVGDLSGSGQGVGRAPSGVVVMVRGAVPGDLARARVTVRHDRHLEAVLEVLIRPSPSRREPRCVHFGVCGGCSLQMFATEAQRQTKARRVRELLRRTGGLPGVACDETVEVGPEYGARSRMEFSFGQGREGLIAGLHRAAGPIFDLHECHLPHPSFARLLAAVRDLGRRHEVPAADPLAGRDGLARLDLRRSAASGEVLLSLHVRGPLPEAFAADLAALCAAGDEPAGIVVIRDDIGSLAARLNVLAGKGEIRESLLGLSLPIGPGTFVQTNLAGAEAIYRAVLEWLEPVAGDRLLDLYAGIGTLAIAAAREFAAVTAVEGEASAVEVGRRAAAENGRAVRFLSGDALLVARRLAAAGETFNAIVVNPPRAGLHRDLPEALAGLAPRRIAYVSCDPATLARDLARLKSRGYETTRVTPFDLFPQTAEVEVLARLELRAAAGVSP